MPAVLWAQSPKPHIVMLIAEREYQTNETLPGFADLHLSDYRTTFVFEDPEDQNRFVGLKAISSADLLVVSVRRRTLPDDQLALVRNYVAAGKPLIGIRTASHAFSLRDKQPPEGRAVWPEFDRQVFGGNYTNHHGNALKAEIWIAGQVSDAARSLLVGLGSIKPFVAGGSLYRVSPLADGASVVMMGRVEGHPAEPVAWSFQRADGGKSFYTSLGHIDDFAGDVLPRLLKNAVAWSLNEQ